MTLYGEVLKFSEMKYKKKNARKVIKWLQGKRLLQKKMNCWRCNRNMKLVEKKVTDFYVW